LIECRRLASTEMRRRHVNKDVLTPTYVFPQQNHVVRAIRKHVQDPDILKDIVDDIDQERDRDRDN